MEVITQILERNAREWPNDVALVEINPQELEKRNTTWREYSLIESNPLEAFRSEITWAEFDRKANRFANFLLSRGLKKGDKVAILLMNCLEWLPIYFGVLKAGCMAVPLNFRYTADEIKYCLELSDADVLVHGPEFTGRIEQIIDRVPRVRFSVYVGDDCPSFDVSYKTMVGYWSSKPPAVSLFEDDDAAIYFSSGTTGFPKAIILRHRALMHSCKVEQNHHGQTKDDVFLCIPPLYHTGAKMHWFGSFLVGGKAVLLKGVQPEWVLRAASEEKCTIVWLLVPWAQDILDAIESGDVKLDDYSLKQWRLMHIGAQPVPPALIRRWKTVFPEHVRLISTPSLTQECMRPEVIDESYFTDANMAKLAKYVRLENVEITEADGTELWAPEELAYNNVVERHIKMGKTNLVLRMSTYADFANEPLPDGKLNINGVLTRYNNYWQFVISSTSDIEQVKEEE